MVEKAVKDRLAEIMDDLDGFCFDHRMTGDDCEKCPFCKYESCPLHDFYIKCWFAIYDGSQLTLKKEV